jgi:hypothetical protein
MVAALSVHGGRAEPAGFWFRDDEKSFAQLEGARCRYEFTRIKPLYHDDAVADDGACFDAPLAGAALAIFGLDDKDMLTGRRTADGRQGNYNMLPGYGGSGYYIDECSGAQEFA